MIRSAAHWCGLCTAYRATHVGPIEDRAARRRREGMKKRRASARNGPAPSQPAGDPSSSGRSEQGTRAFPIVGVGASAGGLDAFTQLLRHVPEKPGVAFVLIQHLDPNHPSLLAEAIGRITTMPVEAIREGTRVEPDHVYVTPPDADVSILHGTLTLLPRPKRRGIPHLPIDFFFRALAADQREWAVGVILSGTGADGVEGLRAIKAEDGLTFAQEPGSAAFAGMPESAVRAGVADVVLPVPELAEELLRLAREPHLGPRDEPLGGPGGDDALKKVIVLVRDSLGADLSEYKSTTLKRRLARRMALRGQRTLPDYIALLREDPKEISALHEDVLIHVTSFFRDAGAFERLKEIVFPAILKHKAPGAPIRIWVAGCSSGEEAYSIAIALFEFLGQDAAANPIQIFGTDISEKAVASARAGLYPDGIARDVSPARLKRFFTRGEHGYQVNRAIREPCVFVRHDLACDPPFSKLDLVSCRNVLIYFNPALQRRLSDTFHFALNRSGFLLLGRSENLVDPDHLFSIADKEQKILARVAVPSTLRLPPRRQLRPRAAQPVQAEALPSTPRDLGEQLEGLLLKRYAPPGVLINERMEILHFRGRTGPYLEPAPGQPQLNLLKMAREGLLADLRIAIAQARKERATVRRSGVQVKQDDSTKTCAIVVVPLAAPPDARDRLFAVLFEDAPPTSEPVSEAGSGRKSRRPRQDEARYAARMEEELRATKEYLQSLVEDHQRANDELLSANEELVSSNEELQSLNEELETAKEELQSTNEELTTLNDEMRSRNTELNLVNSDLLNVLGSVEIPIVIVDGERRIRRFTPRARPLLNLVPADVGRPLDDIKTSLRVGDFDSQIAEVIESARVSESDVQDRDGRWYRLQIRPYLTIDKKIDGAVLSIVDIDALKRALDTAEWAREYAAAT
ncbi:MAG TPA: CheR family methyltransferase, partial [Planctomycetota bacterium]|nr:CheR family methyltransferase [Planctomycetota bacterium]